MEQIRRAAVSGFVAQHVVERAFEMTLTVPPSDCASQQVKLLHDWRSESERFISGNIWFADFKIERQ